jgi:hypothetical protein
LSEAIPAAPVIKPLPLLLLVVLLTVGARTREPQIANGESLAHRIAREAIERDTGRDSRSAIRLRQADRQGHVRERALQLLVLRAGRGTSDAKRVDGPDGDRVLIRLTYPKDVSGTAFLVWLHRGSDAERFLYLPVVGRTRRIAAAETEESFVGTDFSYEDVGGRALEDYEYTLLDDNARWTGPDGRAQAVYRLESRRKHARASLPRIVSLIAKDTFVLVEAEFFGPRQQLQKRYEVRRLDRVQGIWTVLEAVMTSDPEHSTTQLTVEKMEYNVGLREDDFTRRELERGSD